MSGKISVINGKKGGRPKMDSGDSIKLPYVEIVILNSAQYDSLLKKYGEMLLNDALMILENWLKTSPKADKYRGKNNYAHFRSDGWVINAAKLKLRQNE